MSPSATNPSGSELPALSPIEDVLADFKAGKMVIIVDDEDRENEGDLAIAAEFATAEAINFMLREARGYLFLCLTEGACDRLDLHAQSAVNTSVRGTPLTVSIDGHPKHGFTTGVSAHERAQTIQLALNPNSRPDDFVRPGHINPLRSRDGGVLVRIGHTEALVDLCRLTGLTPAAVGIEMMREDGHMARLPDLVEIAKRHNLKIGSIAQIIRHRLAQERLVQREAPAEGVPVMTPYGEFRLITYHSLVDPWPHLALTMGGVGMPGADGKVTESGEPTLVRVHRRDLLGDVFGIAEGDGCASSKTLHAALARIAEEGRGAVVYLRPEGNEGRLSDRLSLIDRARSIVHGAANPDTPDLGAIAQLDPQDNPVEHRVFGVGVQILRDLGLSRLRLLTDRPKDLPALDAFGLEIEEQIPLG